MWKLTLLRTFQCDKCDDQMLGFVSQTQNLDHFKHFLFCKMQFLKVFLSLHFVGLNSAGALGSGDTENRGDGPHEMGDDLLIVDLGSKWWPWAIDSGAFHNCVIGYDANSHYNHSVHCWGTSDCVSSSLVHVTFDHVLQDTMCGVSWDWRMNGPEERFQVKWVIVSLRYCKSPCFISCRSNS